MTVENPAGSAASAAGTLAINVKDAPYNAKGDGATDDTAAINQALADATSLVVPTTARGRVYMPPGQYVISAPISVPRYGRLEGAQGGSYGTNTGTQGATVLQAKAAYVGNMIEVADQANYIDIRNIGIDGKGRAAVGVHIADGSAGQESQAYLEKVFVQGCTGDGFYFGTLRRDNLAFRCVSFNNGGHGFNVKGSDHTVASSIAGNNVGAGFNVSGFVQRIWDCDIFGNGQSGVVLNNGCEDCLVHGNGIDTNSQHGIYIGGGNAVGTVSCNILHSNSEANTNQYSHIKVDVATAGCNLVANVFGPLDTGVSWQTAYGIEVVDGGKATAVGHSAPPVGTCGGSVSTFNHLTNDLGALADPAAAPWLPWQASGLVGWSFDDAATASTGIAVNLGNVTGARIDVPEDIEISAVVVNVMATGALTAGENFAVVCDSAGNTIGQTADCTADLGSVGVKIVPLVAPITVKGGPGVYVRGGVLINGTSSPLFARSAGVNNPLSGSGVLRFARTSNGSNTVVPAAPNFTTSTVSLWVGLS